VRGPGTVVVLGVAGLAIAALLGLSGYFVARETIALPATSLPAGDDLAPAPATTGQATQPQSRTGTTARTTPTPEETTPSRGTPPMTTGRAATETDDDRGRGRGRGRGGDDDDSSGSGSSGDDDGSSDDSGRGRNRGRGGDD
jgi:hypothetical protein